MNAFIARFPSVLSNLQLSTDNPSNVTRDLQSGHITYLSGKEKAKEDRKERQKMRIALYYPKG